MNNLFIGTKRRDYLSTIGRYPILTLFFSTTYFIGELIQGLMIGPEWLRGHLSDFGFPLYFGVFLPMLFEVPTGISVPIAGIAGIAFEIVQFSRGNGDPIDVWCLIAGTAVGIIITLKLNK